MPTAHIRCRTGSSSLIGLTSGLLDPPDGQLVNMRQAPATMKPSSILSLYRARLRTGLIRELLAVTGIAVGVALLFASQVASTSLDGSVTELTSAIVGQMHYQVLARSPEGFDQGLLAQVQSLPSVQRAVPVLEQSVEAIGPSGRESVDLVGVDPRFVRLEGQLERRFSANALAKLNVVAIPRPIAHELGVTSLEPVTLQIGAVRREALVGTEVSPTESRALAGSPVIVAPLAYAQRLAGMPGRITRVFVQPRAGQSAAALAQLEHLSDNRLNVRPADFDASVFKQAATPTNQSTGLFSALSALVGFLFAFNAILLTAGYRRDFVYDLRLDGYTRTQVVQVLMFDALALGALGSALGLGLGEILSLDVFHPDPAYLSVAFPVGSQRIVTWQCVAIAVGGGVLAATVGVLAPLREIFAPFTLTVGEPKQRAARPWRAWAALACLAGTAAIVVDAPELAIAGMALLSLALLLALPSLLDGVVWTFDQLQSRLRGVSPYLAVMELRDRSNRTRSIAAAATGAIAVFGSVAIQGAHSNLLHGLDNASHDVNATADLWVSPSGYSNLLMTTPFPPNDRGKLERLPGVQSVGLYRGGFLDVGERRVWVTAPPRNATQPVPSSQLGGEDLALATTRFRAGGWVVVSQAVAAQEHLHVGDTFILPSPRPTRFRVAALSTNAGWSPGMIVLNSQDYARAWASQDASAYAIVLEPGASPAGVRREAQMALGADTGLTVESAAQREGRDHQTTRQGLSRLTQIARLVLIAALLAMGAAMGALIWQRRSQLADMKVDGYPRALLWRSLVLESVLLLGAGCSIGACFGLCGQLLLSHALASVTGFPVVESFGALAALASVALVTSVAVLIIAIPGYLATGVRPAIGVHE
jgi:putative ABC transport system permease protein